MNLTRIAFSLILFSLSFSTLSADGLYKWRDAHGNIQYGDNPPKNARLEKLDMPLLTVIQDYGSQWKTETPKLDNTTINKFQMQRISAKNPTKYEKFSFIAPKINQLIHSKEGDISAMLSIRPPLKPGHSVIFDMDGKNRKKGIMRIANFSALSVGMHSLKASIINAQGKIIQNTKTIPFRIIRFDSAQSNKKRKH